MILGSCIVDSFRNTIGTSIAGKYEEEIVDTRFIIDEMNMKSIEHIAFWNQIIRNQLYYLSKKNPIPLLIGWDKNHPFLKKYASEGYINLNELFWKNCKFKSSKDYFEIRIADAVGTILNRFYNKKKSIKAFTILEKCILENGKVKLVKLEDFDLAKRLKRKIINPWDKPAENIFK